MDEQDFNKLSNPSYDLEGEKEKEKTMLIESYRNITDILKKYLDMREEYYPVVALWVMGTYLHQNFISYPYLFFNAMKGSGKSRILKLITYLSKDGSMLNSMTEAVLFRTKGCLAIDEFEGVSRKGNEALKELLNSAYKKGIKVKRMKKQKTFTGEEQVVEEFEVFRPILMANIWGMENVLSDRCITMTLEKSSKREVTNLMEIWEYDTNITSQKANLGFLSPECHLCSDVALRKVYKEWNDYIITNITINTTHTNITNITKQELFYKKIADSKINGRDLELCFPLLLIADFVGELDKVLDILITLMKEKKEEDLVESTDISLYDFISQEPETSAFVGVKELTTKFREFLQTNEEWITDRWMGKALNRLCLIKKHRRIGNLGSQVLLDYQKAQKKMEMFR